MYPAGIYTNPVCVLEINVWWYEANTSCPFIPYAAFLLLVEVDSSVFCSSWGRMQVARLTTSLTVHCPDPPDSRKAWSSESLVLYECHYAWPLPEVNSTTVCDFMILLSEGRMSTCAECPPGHLALGQVPPPAHSFLVQTVPLCAECPPTLVVLARTHEGAVEKKFSWSVKYKWELYQKTI